MFKNLRLRKFNIKRNYIRVYVTNTNAYNIMLILLEQWN